MNFDGLIDPLDWPIYNSGRGAAMSSLTLTEAYRLGDLDGDLDNDIADFVLFKDFFEAANGAARSTRCLFPSHLRSAIIDVRRRGLRLAKENIDEVELDTIARHVDCLAVPA